ncbi:GNAT family N-acetyltransferase [Oceaniglobus roseus]|uniref:GNAT family N-acetyltransferase n=1 Tax=Oceaniglobus roseus TaxID=1737570 RepID=UPI000C7E8EE9|nr:GNAT family N-acetyltransferase [Kandeliimicrobium roseum]
MSWHAATGADVPEIEAFLSARLQTSMFPLGNLAAHGLGGGHPRALNVLLRRSPKVDAVFAVTNEGMILPQVPPLMETDWQALREVFLGPFIGAAGEATQVRATLRAFALDTAPTRVGEDEQGYMIDLSDLILPDTTRATLHPIDAANVALATEWRAAYHVEVLGTPADEAQAKAAQDIAHYIEQDSHRLLCRDGAPVAMTGFNTRWRDAVQVGGVFTPPELRRRGHAARALALHLAEARGAGAARAVLFAASEAAASVYRALGFTRGEDFALVLFDGPQGATP